MDTQFNPEAFYADMAAYRKEAAQAAIKDANFEQAVACQSENIEAVWSDLRIEVFDVTSPKGKKDYQDLHNKILESVKSGKDRRGYKLISEDEKWIIDGLEFKMLRVVRWVKFSLHMDKPEDLEKTVKDKFDDIKEKYSRDAQEQSAESSTEEGGPDVNIEQGI